MGQIIDLQVTEDLHNLFVDRYYANVALATVIACFYSVVTWGLGNP